MFSLLIFSFVEFCWFLLLCLFIAVVLFLLFTLFVWNEHRRYAHIPGPKRSNFFLGNLPEIDLKRQLLCEIFRDHARVFGPVFVWWYLYTPVVVISSPELVKHGLVTLNLPKHPKAYSRVAYVFGRVRFVGGGLFSQLDHSKWKERRQLINPAFHRGKLKDLVPKFNSIGDILIEKLSVVADGKTVIDMADEFQKATLDAIGKVAFNLDLNCLKADNSIPRAIFKCLEGYEESYKQPFLRIPLFKHSYQQSVAQSATHLREFARENIRQRRLDIQDGRSVPSDILGMILKGTASDQSIALDDLVDEFVTFFIAGQDTTANQLSFALFETLLNSEIEARIAQEVKEVLGTKESVEFEDISKLEYLGQVLKESLRKHPPAPSLARITTKPETFGNYTIPARTYLAFSIFTLHHSPEHWSNPDNFCPGRFAPSKKQSISNFVYFPFSCGPRVCIGNVFSSFNSTVLMARLFQTFKFDLLPAQKLMLDEKLTIHPKGGVLCTITKRSSLTEK